MNRRNFFKTVTGFVAGLFLSKKVLAEKPKLTVAKLMKVKEALDAQTESGDFLIPANAVETWRASGKRYYVDMINGDDKNDGLTWATAKKNWVKIFD